MFSHKNNHKKAVIHFEDKTEGSSYSSTSIPLNDGKLLEALIGYEERYGQLIIKRTTNDNELFLSSTRAKEHDDTEARLEEINELIRCFVKGRAVPVESFAVFADNQLKGVFGTESMAELKQKTLISKGFLKENIVIKPLHIESFEDFS